MHDAPETPRLGKEKTANYIGASRQQGPRKLGETCVYLPPRHATRHLPGPDLAHDIAGPPRRVDRLLLLLLLLRGSSDVQGRDDRALRRQSLGDIADAVLGDVARRPGPRLGLGLQLLVRSRHGGGVVRGSRHHRPGGPAAARHGDCGLRAVFFDALPVQQVRVDAHAAPPESVRRRRRGDFLLLLLKVALHVVVVVFAVGLECLVARKHHGDGDHGLEALRGVEVGDRVAVAGLLGGRVEEKHAQADEGVAEEDCDAEQQQDEEDVDFLADVFVGQGDGEV